MKDVIVIAQDLKRRDSFYNILVQFNCNVTTIPAFEEFMTIFRNKRPHCVIIDMASCGKEKDTVIEKIREIDQNLKIVAFISQGQGEEEGSQMKGDDNTILLKRDVDVAQAIPSFLKILREKDAQEAEQPVNFRGRILVVEDEEDQADMINLFLTKKGYAVDIASNGEEALLKIRANKPKVVLLDIMMPGMDGLLALKHIKEIDETITVIVTSGMAVEQMINEALALGAAAYLNKPFSFEKLETAILGAAIK